MALRQWHRQLTAEVPVSLFSGSNPNTSGFTGIPGNLLTNIRSASDTNRLWAMGGSGSASTTTGWRQFGAGSSGANIATVVKTSEQTLATATLTDVSQLSFAVSNGGRYHWEFVVAYRQETATVGLVVGITNPAAAVNAFHAEIPSGAAGVDGFHEGYGNSSGDTITAANTPAAGTSFLAKLRGVLVPTADGTLQLQVANETGTSTLTIREGSCGFLTTL